MSMPAISRSSLKQLGVSLLCGASLFALACGGHGGSASKDDLALVPQETQMVFGINVTRMRGTAMWKKAIDVYTSAATEQQKKDYADFSGSCVDPASSDGIESIFVAMPDQTSPSKDGAAIIRLKAAVDDARLNKCGTFLATRNNEKLVVTEYNGKKIYNSGSDASDNGGLTMLDGKTLVLGSGPWLKKMIDITAGKEVASATKNATLSALVKRAKTSDAIWGVGVVPQGARDNMKGDSRMAPLASLQAVLGAVDFAKGLSFEVNMDTGSEADAKAINDQATQQLTQTKKSPQVMMLGVATMLEPIKTEAKGMTFRVSADYTQPQVDEMVARVTGLMKSFGAALGGGGMGGGMGGPPPSMGGGMGGPPPGMGGPPPGMGAASDADATASADMSAAAHGQLRRNPAPGSLSPGKLSPPSAK